MPIPSPINSHCARSSEVARKSRGNHCNGAEISRPSARKTCNASSVKEISIASGSTFSAKMFIPLAAASPRSCRRIVSGGCVAGSKRSRLRGRDPALHAVPRRAVSRGEGAVVGEAFMIPLAAKGNVPSPAKNDAQNAIVFLYRQISREGSGRLQGIGRPKEPANRSVVFTRDEE